LAEQLAGAREAIRRQFEDDDRKFTSDALAGGEDPDVIDRLLERMQRRREPFLREMDEEFERELTDGVSLQIETTAVRARHRG
jgi:hypothetical protein